MMQYFATPQELENSISCRIQPVDSIIDVGCGVRPMVYFKPKTHICIDKFEPYLKALQKRFHSEPGVVILNSDILAAMSLFLDESIDSIFILDAIEHLTKEDGLKILKEAKRIVRKQIIVATPLGFVDQDELAAWGLPENSLQHHLSGWHPKDFGPSWEFFVCQNYAPKQGSTETFGKFYAIYNPLRAKTIIPKSMFLGNTVRLPKLDAHAAQLIAAMSMFDSTCFEALSADHLDPYAPLYRVPDLNSFAVNRLECVYNHFDWPDGWPSSQASKELVEKWSKYLVENLFRQIVLYDFEQRELEFAVKLSTKTNLPLFFLGTEDMKIDHNSYALPNNCQYAYIQMSSLGIIFPDNGVNKDIIDVIYNDGERMLPGLTHSLEELIRHVSSYQFFAKVIEEDMRHNDTWRKESVKILDLGFGTGHGCHLLAQIPGSEVTGIDMSMDCKVFADRHYWMPNISYQIEDIPEFLTKMPPFDYVVSRGVIEHVPDGINCVERANWTKRLLFDVPYLEPEGVNQHHLLSMITEKDFEHFGSIYEILYETTNGSIYFGEVRQPLPNMIMCVASKPGLPSVTTYFDFPIPAWEPSPGMRALFSRVAEAELSLNALTNAQLNQNNVIGDLGASNSFLRKILRRILSKI